MYHHLSLGKSGNTLWAVGASTSICSIIPRALGPIVMRNLQRKDQNSSWEKTNTFSDQKNLAASLYICRQTANNWIDNRFRTFCRSFCKMNASPHGHIRRSSGGGSLNARYLCMRSESLEQSSMLKAYVAGQRSIGDGLTSAKRYMFSRISAGSSKNGDLRIGCWRLRCSRRRGIVV